MHFLKLLLPQTKTNRLYYIIAVFLIFPFNALSWSLKTHIWIAQQILNDITDDGKVKLLNGEYPVAPHIVQALRAHPNEFRMGCLGPDVFPDAIVGQTTTHPGVVHGWQTDDWLKHLLKSASTPQEIAFAYGYVIHAAGDIFAHTYVNAFAGDIFELKGDERDVELRHFVLEKYIERLTPHPMLSDGRPLDWMRDFGTPTAFLRDNLILNGAVSKQYIKSGTGFHLSSMYGVRVGVLELDNTTGKLIATLTKWGAKYFKEQLKLTVDLTTAKHAIVAAEKGLEIQTEILKAKRMAYEAALSILNEAKEIVVKNPELIAFNENLLAEQIKIAADLTAKSLSVTADVASKLSDLQNQINNLEREIVGKACHLLGPREVNVLVGKIPNPARIACDEIVAPLADKVLNLKNQISSHQLAADIAQKAAKEAEKLRDDTKQLVDKLKASYNKAVAGLAQKSYEATVLAAETELKSQEKVVEKAREGVVKAKELQQKIEKEINKIIPIIDEIKKAIDKYNGVTLLVRNWLKGIDIASEEYIKASHQAGLKMLNNSGNPLSDYSEWFKCYGSVFMAVPHQVGTAVCLVENNLKKIKEEYQKLIDELPDILRWMINPTGEASKLAFKKLEPELKKAEFELAKFLTDKQTAEFLFLLTNPENATQEKLTSVYSSDHSRKNLLLIPEIASFIEKDTKLQNGLLNPNKFNPLIHSITLAKLALLDPSTLNTLIHDLTGEYSSPIYGREVYRSSNTNFIFLLDAVRSIDGNHQWQAYGLPYPRRNGIHISPSELNYGYDYHKEPVKGFRIWVDPFLREKVFLVLFNGSILGALGERAELKWPKYSYPECAQNPYPSTQTNSGDNTQPDLLCTQLTYPNISITDIKFKNANEYAKRYFQCNDVIEKNLYSTLVASFLTKEQAEKQKEIFLLRFPDLHLEVSERRSPNRFWTVLMASCTSKELALEARDIAIRRQMDSKSFILDSDAPYQVSVDSARSTK